MNENEFAELAAGHALHALSDADERRYIDALLRHPEWTRTADDDVQTAVSLADGAAPVAPPAQIRDALLSQISRTPQGEGVPVDAQGQRSPARRRRWSRGLFALAASVVLIVGLGVGAAILIPQLVQPASVVALERIEAAPDAQQASVELEGGAQATAHWSASVGSAVLVTDGLDALTEDQTYQLWFVRGEDPLPAGFFEAENGPATALLEGTMQEGDVIAVTVEPAGGSPTGIPTSDPIIAIPTA